MHDTYGDADTRRYRSCLASVPTAVCSLRSIGHNTISQRGRKRCPGPLSSGTLGCLSLGNYMFVAIARASRQSSISPPDRLCETPVDRSTLSSCLARVRWITRNNDPNLRSALTEYLMRDSLNARLSQ